MQRSRKGRSVTPTIGSLFTGIGGFDLGFEMAGFKTAWQVEIDEYRQKVLAGLFPGAERFRDIHECSKANLKPVDVIVGGDPCQENSNARRAHATINPSLGGQFIRIVDELRPRIVLRENPSAIRADAPWPWFRFRNSLERLGYAVLPFRLRACCTGAEHQRERLFLLAELQDSNGARLEGAEREELARTLEGEYHPDITRSIGGGAAPRICRKPDGIPNRRKRLESLGNAVDVRVSEFIAKQIMQSLKGKVAA